MEWVVEDKIRELCVEEKMEICRQGPGINGGNWEILSWETLRGFVDSREQHMKFVDSREQHMKFVMDKIFESAKS